MLATSKSNRFSNPRPCIYPVRPNIVQDTERSPRGVYTKTENILVDSVPNQTQGQPSKNSKSTYTKNEDFLGEGESRKRGEPAESHSAEPSRATGLPPTPYVCRPFHSTRHPVDIQALSSTRLPADIQQHTPSGTPIELHPDRAPNKARQGTTHIYTPSNCAPLKSPVLTAAALPNRPPTESEPKRSQHSTTFEPAPFHALTAAKFLERQPPTDNEPKQSQRFRDLLPLPVPDNEGIEYEGSRCVKRRLLRESHASGNSVVALNTLCVGSDSAERNIHSR